MINPRWCLFLVPNFSSSALPGTTYDMQKKTVPRVLSTHPKFKNSPFFLPLESSVRDRKNNILKEKSDFLALVYYDPNFHTFSHTYNEINFRWWCFYSQKKKKCFLYCVYWNPLITELLDSDKCLDNSDYSQGSPRQSNCSFSNREMRKKKKKINRWFSDCTESCWKIKASPPTESSRSANPCSSVRISLQGEDPQGWMIF